MEHAATKGTRPTPFQNCPTKIVGKKFKHLVIQDKTIELPVYSAVKFLEPFYTCTTWLHLAAGIFLSSNTFVFSSTIAFEMFERQFPSHSVWRNRRFIQQVAIKIRIFRR
jgi:hypothetical protein